MRLIWSQPSDPKEAQRRAPKLPIRSLTPFFLSSFLDFLDALTTADFDERMNMTIPSSVPSGFPIDQLGILIFG